MKTKQTKPLTTLIKQGKFSYVNSNITLENFPVEEIRSDDYKLFHFDRYISSEDAVKEMEKEGFKPVNIYELLSWKEWNGKDPVVGLGSSCAVRDARHVPCLRVWYGRSLSLDWWFEVWFDCWRFLAVRTQSLGTKDTETLGHSDPKTLCPHCGGEVKVTIEKI